jgi:hypothetical protein
MGMQNLSGRRRGEIYHASVPVLTACMGDPERFLGVSFRLMDKYTSLFET